MEMEPSNISMDRHQMQENGSKENIVAADTKASDAKPSTLDQPTKDGHDIPEAVNTGDGNIPDPAHTPGAAVAGTKKQRAEADKIAREALLGTPDPVVPVVKVEVKDDPELRKGKEELLDTFLEESGYKARDVDVINLARRTLGTTNGGKYQINRQGALLRLKGPRYPKEEVPA